MLHKVLLNSILTYISDETVTKRSDQYLELKIEQ